MAKLRDVVNENETGEEVKCRESGAAGATRWRRKRSGDPQKRKTVIERPCEHVMHRSSSVMALCLLPSVCSSYFQADPNFTPGWHLSFEGMRVRELAASQ